MTHCKKFAVPAALAEISAPGVFLLYEGCNLESTLIRRPFDC